MPAVKLLNIIALATFAVLTASFGPTPTAALSVENHNFIRRHPDHHLIAKRQAPSESPVSRKRCRPRPTSEALPVPVSTSPAQPTQEAPQPEPTTAAPQPSQPEPAPAPAPAPPAPVPAPPPTNGNAGGGKAGLAWTYADPKLIPSWLSSKVGFVYTWSPFRPDGTKGKVPFAAMLWGHKQIGDFTSQIHGPGDADYILGFNEPNQEGQSLMSPEEGARMWKQYINPMRYQGIPTVSPACTNAPSGKKWLEDWFAACAGDCEPNFIGTHFYGTKSSDLIAHLELYYDTFKKPIWLTEFACQNFGGGAQCSYQEVVNFMNEATSWMDNSYKVDKYAWFGAFTDMVGVNTFNQLMDWNGYPNDLGKNYVDA